VPLRAEGRRRLVCIGQAYRVYHLRGKWSRPTPRRPKSRSTTTPSPASWTRWTMPYKLKDAKHPERAASRRRAHRRRACAARPNGNTLLDHIVVVAEARPDYRPKVTYHVPAPGDAVPDFKLRNQDGARSISRSSTARRCWSRSSTRAARCRTSARASRITSRLSRQSWPPIRAAREDSPGLRKLRSGKRYAGAAQGLWRDVYW